VWAPHEARTLDLLLKNQSSTANVNEQKDLLHLFGKEIRDYIQKLFYQSDILPEDLVQFWSLKNLEDHHYTLLTDKVSSKEVVEDLYLNLIGISLLPSEKSILENDDFKWILENGIHSKFYDSMTTVVNAYEKNYEENIKSRTGVMNYLSLGAAALPIITFLAVFLPKWRMVRNEIAATTSLFARIPRPVAIVLGKGMKTKLKTYMETYGKEKGSGEKDETSQLDAMDSSKMFSNHESDGKNELAKKVLVGYVLSLFLILVMMLAIALCISTALNISFSRASLMNQSSKRYSLAYRISTELRELSVLNSTDPSFASWKQSLQTRVDELLRTHYSMLFGDNKINIQRIFGQNSDVDTVTLNVPCNNTGVQCLSLDTSIYYLCNIVQQAIDIKITPKILSEVNLIPARNGTFLTSLNQLTNIFGEMNNELVVGLTRAAQALFFIMFPSILAIYTFLERLLHLVMSRIKRTRYVSLQL
jgi:hypothetical protein